MGERRGESDDISETEIQRAGLLYLLEHPRVALVWQNDLKIKRLQKYGGVGRFRPKGLPDVTGFFHGGNFFAVEFKKPGGKISPEQFEILAKIKSAGGFSTVAFSVEDLKQWLERIL